MSSSASYPIVVLDHGGLDRCKCVLVVDASAGVDILVLLYDIVLDTHRGIFLVVRFGTAFVQAFDDEVWVAVIVERNTVSLSSRTVDDTMDVGDVDIICPLLE